MEVLLGFISKDGLWLSAVSHTDTSPTLKYTRHWYTIGQLRMQGGCQGSLSMEVLGVFLGVPLDSRNADPAHAVSLQAILVTSNWPAGDSRLLQDKSMGAGSSTVTSKLP